MLTIIVKGTNGCNLACSYCSLGEKKNFRYVTKESFMDVMDFACNLAEYRGEKGIHFILHGGEPTLIHPDVYETGIIYVKTKHPKLNITISMQTNGYSLTDAYIRFCKKYDINVGISIDGSKEIHDSERKTANGKESYKLVISSIEKLLEEDIQVSCLMVLTQNALDKNLDYLQYFARKKLHLKINPLLNYGEAAIHPELVLETGDYAKYIIRVYEEIIKSNLDVYISPIDKIISGILHDQPIRECSFHENCNRHFLCIDYKGDLYPCGKFSDIDKMCIGNIADSTYEEVEQFISTHLCTRRTEKIPYKCLKCKYLNLCHGGCSAEAMINGNFYDVPASCDDYISLFRYFYTDGLRLLREKLIQNKQYLEEQTRNEL